MAISEDTAPHDAPPALPIDQSTNPVFSLLFFAIVSGIVSTLNLFVGEWIHLPKAGTVASHLISLTFLAITLFLLLKLAESTTRLRVSTAFLFLTGLALAAPVLISILAGIGTISISKVFAPLAGIIDALPPPVRFAISNFLGPVGEVFMGASVGRLFKHPNTVLAGAGFASFFDLVVVTMGPVAQLMNRGANVIAMVSLGGASGASAPGDAGHHMHSVPQLSAVTIGPADILFMAVFLGAVHQIALARKATFWWMYGLLMFALVLADTTPLPVPALVPMGIAVIIANARFGAFTKTEKRDLAIGAAFALLCACGIIAGARRLLSTPDVRGMHYGFELGRVKGSNAIVVSVIVRDSPADKAGLRPGDEVLAIDGTPAASITADALKQDSLKPVLELQITRPGATKPLDLTLRAVQ